MRFYLDENMPVQVVHQLRSLYLDHEFVHPNVDTDLGLVAMGDIELFDYLGCNGFTAIITNDFNQMKRYDEAEALLRNRVHWIGMPQPKFGGVQRIAFMAAGISFVLPNFLGGDLTEVVKCEARLPGHNAPKVTSLAEHIRKHRQWKNSQK